MGQRLENAKRLYLEAIRDGDYENAIHRYAGGRYTQHSTPVKDGKDGFIEFFADFVKRNPVRDIEVVRAFEDGQYVFLHVLQNLNNGEWRYVTADIFDTDDDSKLIEHWDIIAEMQAKTASGRTELDGPTEPKDLDQTQANKQLVRRFIDEVLVPRDLDRLSEFLAADVAQHNPGIADGLEAFREHAAGSGLRCVKARNVIGCGDFVAALAEYEIGGKPSAVIDLFRVDNGRIVEHWDVIETITPRETWVNSGKF
ncbi:MAG: nuclear transport factor 2 family protein [Myxococcota bacterium]